MSREGAPLLRLDGASFGYDGVAVVRSIDLEVHGGELVALLGGNGSGKTTLLRGLLGLLRPLSGRVVICDELGYVPQRDGLDPIVPATVEELVAMGTLDAARKVDRAERRRRVAEAIESVGLTFAAHRLFTELSGGQLRRALLARALVADPKLLILDEPFAGVDERARREVFDVLLSLRSTRSIGILMVGHEIDDLLSDVDGVARLHDGSLVSERVSGD
ncbi:MAG: ATP-binding cassette domain-containing protein [Planctomycetota bacterium]